MFALKGLVLRLGEPVAGRGLITTPGLHFTVRPCVLR
jgi:hypothetical protein